MLMVMVSITAIKPELRENVWEDQTQKESLGSIFSVQTLLTIKMHYFYNALNMHSLHLKFPEVHLGPTAL